MESEQKKTNHHDYLEVVHQFVDEIQFGTVTIVVQDGKIVQIEKNEKYRMKN